MMKNKLICALTFVALLTACGRSGGRSGNQQNFETVQEGSAAGVTSTIHGPGEVLPPITGTNADTTSAFALNPNALPATPAPAPGVGMLPPPQSAYGAPAAQPSVQRVPPPMTSAAPQPSRPVDVPAPRPAQQQPEHRPEEAAPPAPPVEPQTDTATETAEPQPTETTEPADDTQPEPADETAPPPTTTTTQGNG